TSGSAFAQVLSRSPEVDGPSWILHATASIKSSPAGRKTPEPAQALDRIRARCEEEVSRGGHYEDMAKRGLPYGPGFQSVETIWRGNGEALGRVRLPEHLQAASAAYWVHPVLLDAAFQVVVATLPDSDATGDRKATWLPIGLESLRIHSTPGNEAWGHAVLR